MTAVTYERDQLGRTRPVVDHTGDPLVPASVAAEHFDVTPETIRIKARAGIIPGIRIGRAWRFDIAAITAALTPSTDPWAQSPQSARARRKR